MVFGKGRDELASSQEARKWTDTKTLLGNESVTLGPYFSFIVKKTPRRLLHMLSYYKFAAKMIGAGQRVMDVGCSEGLGTVILAESATQCIGVDLDHDAIDHANRTLANEKLSFRCADALERPFGEFGAITSFDVIEHIYPEHAEQFLSVLAQSLNEDGIMIIGTPNINADQYASAHSRAGHVNLYSADRLHDALAPYFHRVFMFSGNDEVVHTGFSPLAHYLMAMGVVPKKQP